MDERLMDERLGRLALSRTAFSGVPQTARP